MNLRDRPDVELLALTLGGATDSYASLVSRYQAAVHGLVYSIVASPSEAEQLTQEAFVRAYVALGQLRDRDRFAPWLRRLTVGVCVSWLEVHDPQRLPRTGELDDLDARNQPDVEPRVSPDPAPQDGSTDALVRGALSSLPARYRVPLVMLQLDGSSDEAAASILGKPVASVKSLVNRAHTLLRAALGQRVPDVPQAIGRLL